MLQYKKILKLRVNKMNAFDVSGLFSTQTDAVSVKPYGNGHINSTFLVTAQSGKRYILQKVNGRVFKNPEQVMQNIIKVTEYLRSRLSGAMKTLTLVELKNGKKYFTDESGEIWRMYDFIENAVSLELPETENDFYQSAVAFGAFQNMLKDFPASELYETIPNFHNTPLRFKSFTEAAELNPMNRAKNALPEIEFIKTRKSFCSTLEESRQNGDLPLKVTHNDTKLNNVMLDKDTREPVCVIDLDTVMPGYSVNDFGDSIRFGASTAAEDEKDLSKVHFDINLYNTYAKGFLFGCGGTLTESERRLLPVGAKMMTLECGMRFLTDYLLGDTYFKTAYPEHNLVRCRTQLKLVSEMEKHESEMLAAVL